MVGDEVLNWLGLILGAAGLAAVFWAGDNFGWNAHEYAKVVAASKIRNAELARLKRKDKVAEVQEKAQFDAADKDFAGKKVGACVINAEQAQAFQTHSLELMGN